ncbi:MAG: hypothetical protein ABIS84_13710 [Arachnia sp.]
MVGPWSLAMSARVWRRSSCVVDDLSSTSHNGTVGITFRAECDWRLVEARISQRDDHAVIHVTGDGDLEAAAAQVLRFTSLDVDATEWPRVAERDPVMADAQTQLEGLRPWGFHSPYEAAAWSVMVGRMRGDEAVRAWKGFIYQHGEEGALPCPNVLRQRVEEMPGRKPGYLHDVAVAALDGRLDASFLRSLDPASARAKLGRIRGLGPAGIDTVLTLGANAPDLLPRHDRLLAQGMAERYGPEHDLSEVSEAWSPFRSWAALYLGVLSEQGTRE